MSGALLHSSMILLPVLTDAAWTSTSGSPSASSTIIANSIGVLSATRDGGPTVDLIGWLQFQTTAVQSLFEAMLTVVSGGAGWSGSGAWQDLSAGFNWSGITFGDTVSVVRLDIRLKSSTTILATATFTVTFDVS